uniref:F-box domain-containing protein n=1 Tax=Strongyloides papillosus TaxID=174720 RepID=A0A0N5BVA9_STREA
MDAEEISFINIMEISLIRRKILEYIPSFKDITCLASTCWELNKIIKNVKITRDLHFYFNDKIDIAFAKIDDIVRLTEGHIDVQEESKFEDCAFMEKFNFRNNGGQKDEKLNIDKFICDNTVRISLLNIYGEVSSEKYVQFITKLAQQYKINSEERRNLTILKLHDQRYGSKFNALLHVLPYLHHENINTIIIPIRFFSIDLIKYDGFLNNLFDGFPKLYRLGIDLSFRSNIYNNFSHNKNAIDKIMKQLSKKKNASIYFYKYDGSFFRTVYYFLVFFKIAMKYGIKVTMEDRTLLQLKERGISDILMNHDYPLERCVTASVNRIDFLDSSSYDCFRRMRCYENLKMVSLVFSYNLYLCSLEKDFKAFGDIQSLNNLKKVIAIELTFVKHHDGIDEDEIEIFHKNVKYLIQLLPRSVERLQLFGIPKLNYDLTRTIRRHMKNIEVLSLCNVSIEETDCLSVFKKLQVVSIRSDIPIKIPDSVKLFAIYTRESAEQDIIKKLTNEYSKKFSKKLTDNRGRDIFFNDINDWKCYNHMLRMEYSFYDEYMYFDR